MHNLLNRLFGKTSLGQKYLAIADEAIRATHVHSRERAASRARNSPNGDPQGGSASVQSSSPERAISSRTSDFSRSPDRKVQASGVPPLQTPSLSVQEYAEDDTEPLLPWAPVVPVSVLGRGKRRRGVTECSDESSSLLLSSRARSMTGPSTHSPHSPSITTIPRVFPPWGGEAIGLYSGAGGGHYEGDDDLDDTSHLISNTDTSVNGCGGGTELLTVRQRSYTNESRISRISRLSSRATQIISTQRRLMVVAPQLYSSFVTTVSAQLVASQYAKTPNGGLWQLPTYLLYEYYMATSVAALLAAK
jgi:hypothetical protein